MQSNVEVSLLVLPVKRVARQASLLERTDIETAKYSDSSANNPTMKQRQISHGNPLVLQYILARFMSLSFEKRIPRVVVAQELVEFQ